ncbi:hypothetical protein ABQH43_06995, partial [Streptococcus sp. ZJ100]|uniref:hypothetical protein n=1 Tax=Streptococcus handemini TaxID=3161188 RepID=UPI0032ED792D
LEKSQANYYKNLFKNESNYAILFRVTKLRRLSLPSLEVVLMYVSHKIQEKGDGRACPFMKR